jgi:acetylornithine deacetylase/succinyl-diaminopimelate desuccinylase-like protein
MLTLSGAARIVIDEATERAGNLVVDDGVVVDAAARSGGETIDVSGCVITPGLVNAHHHLLQTAFRTLPGTRGVPMSDWLPTMAAASEKMNVIPSRAQIRVDCRVPPGLGEAAARKRIAEVLGDMPDVSIEFTEQVIGNGSSVESELMSAIERWVQANDPGARAVPVILPGFSDSRWFRDAFPECVAYGFFPQRHQTLLEAAPLVHNADERIDVRDLGFAATFYADVARELLG